MIFFEFLSCFTIGAIYFAVSVGHELRHFCKTTAVTFIFRFSSPIVHFIKPNISGGPPATAKLVVMSAVYTYTDAVTKVLVILVRN